MTEPPCLVFALRREAGPFLRRLQSVRVDPAAPWKGNGWTGTTPGGRPVRVLLCCVGRYSADAMLKKWLAGGRAPPLLVSAGFAGALIPGIDIGSLVRPAELVDDKTGRVWAVTGVPGVSGRMVTHTFMIGDPDDKEALGKKWRADAVDMESAALARVCAERSSPFGCVRAISDRMQDCLATELLALIEGHGRREISFVRLVRGLLRRPSFLFELWRLARDTRRAARVLGVELVQLLDEEAPPAAGGA